jgi:3-oxosteroid 1-dehydrogenase
MDVWDELTDVVVVGSGAAGLTAALAAHAGGASVIVLERAAVVAGSTTLAGGGMWVPANRFMLADGDHDSDELALEYLTHTVGDELVASGAPRRVAFVRNVRAAISFLEAQGLRFRRTPGYPDYHPDLPGGSVAGRAIEPEVIDVHTLGPWADRLPPRAFPRNLPMGTLDVSRVVLARRTVDGAARFGRILGHFALSRARGQRLIAGGGSLAAQLVRSTIARGISLRLETAAVELVLGEGRAVGVVAERADGRRVRIGARRAVFLGAGGFARNEEMRRKYQAAPVTGAWTSASTSDLGDGIRLGVSAGAATELMDEAWWGPAAYLPGRGAVFLVSERSKPGSIIVDATGHRYMNEAQSYVTAVHAMIARNRDVPAVPSWLVFDADFRSRYPFGAFLPRRTPQHLIDNGFFTRRDTIGELAAVCGITGLALAATVERFNEFARSGHDEDFDRGGNAYDRYYGDPRVTPNACLGPIAKPPFYAVQIFPGDLGTKGGLVTDVDGRVLREGGDPIPGLYASGNTTASVMGRSYPGPGCTLAPTVTFAWLAMRHALRGLAD